MRVCENETGDRSYCTVLKRGVQRRCGGMREAYVGGGCPPPGGGENPKAESGNLRARRQWRQINLRCVSGAYTASMGRDSPDGVFPVLENAGRGISASRLDRSGFNQHRCWVCGKPGIVLLPDGSYYADIKTLTMKLPEGWLGWIEAEAKRTRQPKSAVVREVLQQHQQRQHQSALDLAADLCGCVQSGLRDLARSKKHLKGFGQ